MLALDEYCQRVSIGRVLTVCSLFPLGPLLVIVLTEFMPLQPVEKGPLTNYVFWIRHTLMGILILMCAMMQAKAWIPDMAMTIQQVLAVAIGSSAVYTASNIVIADLWVFPIPFLVVAGAPLMFIIWAIISRIVLRPCPLEGVQDGDFRGRQFLLLTSVHASLLGLYPAYQAVFLALEGLLQLGMIALLPAINLALKNLQTAIGSHLEDNLPEVIIFSIDVFSAIYSVLCMHSANSMKMVAITMVLNTTVMFLSLHGMNRRVARACRSFQLMERQLEKLRRRQSVLDSVITTAGNPALLSTLVDTMLRLLQAPGQLDTTELQAIRLYSGMPLQLSDTNVALLDSLAARSVYNNSRRTTESVSVARMKERYSSAAMEGRPLRASEIPIPAPSHSIIVRRLRGAALVIPTTRWLSSRISTRTKTSEKLLPLVSKNNPVIGVVLDETRKQNTRAIKQTLQLLFNNEYIGLIAYTQCIIPVLYLLYMPALQAMPNHVYYPTHYRYFGDAIEFEERMTVVGILALLQLLVLVSLQVIVMKRFGISTIYQVAFVLESRFLLLQGRVLMWLIFAVQSTLVHYGRFRLLQQFSSVFEGSDVY
ncbi:uncharacterized protein PITG_15599 [Phytophthora infestans T30-4]|uniref:Transmembrane protein n=1 Tax=Phytophthora infestans (strain T30-4) TaxID=403677 RepID=D0NT54_PHYIT|nr:uncharacterized protein PITG_15599 [Phytophthora infestans T30-4]EEY64810.1 conserved hypothetical protein [Phytophthora infestans T30-4]|eukprot:XP_002897737.1 conserved hypothetical protein [Phytophthora infestans T30-4]